MEIRIVKIKELKIKCKELASNVRLARAQLKDIQRGKIKVQDYPFYGTTCPSWVFRHHHIAYCLLRGRKYIEIENKVNPSKEPNWRLIESILSEYREVDAIATFDKRLPDMLSILNLL